MRTMCAIWTVGLSAMLVVAGCGPSRSESDWAAWARAQATRSPSAASLTHHPERAATQPAADVEVRAGAGPEEYVQLALQRNPSIRAAEAAVLRMANRIPQATALDDPMLQVATIGEMAETAAGQVGLMATLSQKLPFPGKLSARGRIAAQEMAQAAARLEQTRLGVVADVRRAYWSYYFAGQAIDVTRQTRELLRQFRQIADTRFRAGQANQADVLRASVELSHLDSELIALEQRKTTAAAMLNSLLDRPVDAALPRPLAAQPRPLDLRLEAILAQASAANPELQALRHRIEAERQRLGLARLQRYPDLTISGTYNFVGDEGLSMAANGKDQWWIGLGINLPIWFEKYRAAEREALRGRQEAIAELGAAQNRIAMRVQDALVRVQAQQRQVQLFADAIIPQARQTVDASLAGYQAGRVDFLTLIDNWRRLLGYQVLHHQNLSQLERDLAELEQVVGQEIGRPAAVSSPATQVGVQSTNQRSQSDE